MEYENTMYGYVSSINHWKITDPRSNDYFKYLVGIWTNNGNTCTISKEATWHGTIPSNYIMDDSIMDNIIVRNSITVVHRFFYNMRNGKTTN